MKTRNLKMSVAVLSCFGILISPVAAAPVSAGPAVVAPKDITLHEGGVLLGQVVDTQGASVASSEVTLYSGGKEIARTQTDKTGKFSVSGLKGGVYHVASASNHGVYRLWSAQTAPPKAGRGVMLVSGSDIARGQNGPFGGVANWIAQHPLMTAGAVAAAIAIPIALDDDDPPATP